MLSKFKTLLVTSALALSMPVMAGAQCNTVVDSHNNPVRTKDGGYVLTKWSSQDAACTELSMIGKEHMVFFGFNDAHLKDRALNKIHRVYQDLSTSKSQVMITLVGHADYTGSAKYNMKLSRDRAEAVKNELVTLGVQSNHIKVMAKGYSELLVPTEKGVKEPKNRRVEIFYAIEDK